MKPKSKAVAIRYRSVEEFGKSIGLSAVDIEMIRQKKALIEKLKAKRIEAGLSQAALARKMNTKQPAIARMEAGQAGQVSLDFLARIALVLGVSVTLRPLGKAA